MGERSRGCRVVLGRPRHPDTGRRSGKSRHGGIDCAIRKSRRGPERAVTDEKMGLVCHANAQRAAAGRGVTVKGNQVLMVFRNDFAVRLLAADPTAGFEAPIRIYVYENADGTATISYLPPSVVFAPYRHAEVQAVARELDGIFKAIVDRGAAAQ
jgi:uncharacterized protein (DUF302 family)